MHATEPGLLYALEREHFVSGVTGNPRSVIAADGVIEARLAHALSAVYNPVRMGARAVRIRSDRRWWRLPSRWPRRCGSADKVCVEHPAVQDDSVVCVRDNWQTVDVCDRKDDGHRTFARVVTKSTYPAYRSPYYDSNDGAAGCSNLHFGSQVVSVAVCVQTKGCSGYEGDRGVAPPDNTTPQPTPTPRARPRRRPTPAPPPPPPSSGGITVGVGLGCVRNGKRMRVTLKVHKQPGKAKPRVKRVVFFYRSNRRSRSSAADKSAPYKRRLPVSGSRPAST